LPDLSGAFLKPPMNRQTTNKLRLRKNGETDSIAFFGLNHPGRIYRFFQPPDNPTTLSFLSGKRVFRRAGRPAISIY
jgi:hypothetical protein